MSESITSEVTKMRLPSGALEGPTVGILLNLALPTILVLTVQTAVGLAEYFFIGQLGDNALVGVSMVFPLVMLMQMLSNGGIGAGVSSAIARAVGNNRIGDANALVWHALVTAVVLGGIFGAAAIIGGPAIYSSLDVSVSSRAAALEYSNWVFAGSIPLWIVALLSAALRGNGQVKLPAYITLASALILIPLSPALIFGWGPLPSLGVAGGGIAFTIFYSIAAVVLIRYLLSNSAGPLRLRSQKGQIRLFREIMGVGTLSAIGTVQLNLMIILITVAVGYFGPNAVAGFGTAVRLEYLLIPVLFGLGTAVVTLVGFNEGAGLRKRACHIAWVGAGLGFLFAETVGLLVAIFPDSWIGLFSSNPQVIEHGTAYLQKIGPVYGFIAIGMMLYFASQGAKQVHWTILAGTARLTVAGFLGLYFAMNQKVSLDALYSLIAVAALLYALIPAATLFFGFWLRCESIPEHPNRANDPLKDPGL